MWFSQHHFSRYHLHHDTVNWVRSLYRYIRDSQRRITGSQELTELGNSTAFSKAPRCTWSPIPPAELRGENFEYLTTNGGFVSVGTCILLQSYRIVKNRLVFSQNRTKNCYFATLQMSFRTMSKGQKETKLHGFCWTSLDMWNIM